ncbi:hypothetical protein H5410_009444 [Solanum commersonii]|uniref:Uncharacterized protein n=1 Tax=Solanum commersonii TaxID=4109 RepID=A0A9J6AJK4_SOLCO|nr:hypothetical protein H5410_009444 [Solanum commersonii]
MACESCSKNSNVIAWQNDQHGRDTGSVFILWFLTSLLYLSHIKQLIAAQGNGSAKQLPDSLFFSYISN